MDFIARVQDWTKAAWSSLKASKWWVIIVGAFMFLTGEQVPITDQPDISALYAPSPLGLVGVQAVDGPDTTAVTEYPIASYFKAAALEVYGEAPAIIPRSYESAEVSNEEVLAEVQDYFDMAFIIKTGLSRALEDGKITFFESVNLSFTVYPTISKAITGSKTAILFFATNTEADIQALIGNIPGLIGDEAWQKTGKGLIYLSAGIGQAVTKKPASE